MGERHVLAKAFPNAVLVLCLFHVQCSFRREVTTDKMGISAAQQDADLSIFQRLVYSHKEEIYEKELQNLKETNIGTCIEYFMKNWHPMRNEWVVVVVVYLTTNQRHMGYLSSVGG